MQSRESERERDGETEIRKTDKNKKAYNRRRSDGKVFSLYVTFNITQSYMLYHYYRFLGTNTFCYYSYASVLHTSTKHTTINTRLLPY